MAKAVCSKPGCPALVDKGGRTNLCQAHDREADRARGTRQQRGYGAEHDAMKATIEDAYGQPCHLCGERMWPHQALEPDHTEDRTAYRGWTHATCNHRDGAIRGNQYRH